MGPGRNPILFLSNCVMAVAHGAEEWFFTRHVPWLVQGLPALFATGIVIALFPFGSSDRNVPLQDRYNAAIRHAWQHNDLDTAELYLHKLLQLGGSRDDVYYRLATLAETRGQHGKALRMMTELAPDDSQKHAGAHLWRARQLLSQRIASQKELATIIHHFEASLRDPSIKGDAHSILGQLYLAQGKHLEAIRHFEVAVESQPRLRLMLAKAYAAQGNQSGAKRELESAAEYLQSALTKETENTELRLWLAECYLLLRQFEHCEKTLRGGLSGQQPDRFRQALADLNVLRFDTPLESNGDDISSRFRFLDEALQLVPNHAPSLVRMVSFVKDDGDRGERAKKTVQDALAKGYAAPLLHVVLGTRAAAEGNLSVAELHLSQAQRLNPAAPAILNNLAWVLARQEPPRLDEALALANSAVQHDPKNIHVRETRGQILVKLKNWREAIVDLEIALQGMPRNADLHASLADVYQQLGETEMSARHQALAKSGVNSSTPTTGPVTDSNSLLQPSVKPLP